MSLLARLYLAVLGVVGLVTGVVLVTRPDQTADYFVWPINPPATALFIGAGYLGTGITLIMALVSARSWSQVRLFTLPVAAFATMMLIATGLHAERFFWDRPQTWLWITPYGVILVGAVGLSLQERGPSNGLGIRRLGRAQTAVLVGVGILMAIWAGAMFSVPSLAGTLWPWGLTPLTARVVGGWVGVGAVLGVAAGLAGDVASTRLPLAGWMITVALFIAAGLASLSAMVPDDPRTWIYFGALGASIPGAAWMLRESENSRL